MRVNGQFKKDMRKYDKGEMARIILSALLAAGVLTVALTAPNAMRLFGYFKPKNTTERNRIKKSLSRLEKQGLIKQKDAMDGYFTLTAEGKAKAMRYRIEHTKIQRQKKWDGRWRLVMFDVPEEKKRARQAINFALKKIGCARYQKSVFIAPFPCEKEINFVGNVFDARKHIRLVVAERIEGEKTFRARFGL